MGPIADLSAEVVSTVDGEPVSLREVREMADETGLPARVTLRRLQDRILLAREAAARGLGGGATGRRKERQAAVQALLAEEVEAKEPPEAALRAAYEGQRSRFVHGERRASIHIVAQVGPDAEPALRTRARSLAMRAQGVLAAEGDLAAIKARVATLAEPAVPLKAERLPPVERDGPLVERFSAALFDAAGPGLLPEVVETKFGFHAVALTEIEPPEHRPFEAVRAQLVAELRDTHRQKRLAALLERLLRTHRVERAPGVLEALPGAGL